MRHVEKQPRASAPVERPQCRVGWYAYLGVLAEVLIQLAPPCELVEVQARVQKRQAVLLNVASDGVNLVPSAGQLANNERPARIVPLVWLGAKLYGRRVD